MKNKIVMITEETHRKLKLLAVMRGVTMKVLIDQLIEDYSKSSQK
jgi:hypothetical protein